MESDDNEYLIKDFVSDFEEHFERLARQFMGSYSDYQDSLGFIILPGFLMIVLGVVAYLANWYDFYFWKSVSFGFTFCFWFIYYGSKAHAQYVACGNYVFLMRRLTESHFKGRYRFVFKEYKVKLVAHYEKGEALNLWQKNFSEFYDYFYKNLH